MPVHTVNLSEFAEEIGKFTKGRLEEFKDAAARGIYRSIPDVVKASPVDTGLYAASWDFTKEEEKIIFGNYAPHAPIIEFGARPFKPPIMPLLAWAKRVLKDSSQPPGYSDRVWMLAKGTQKKIEREGMKPKHIMLNSIPVIIANIKKEFRKL